ncbi:MAG: M36 family metallopeptidase [Xanthomonadales bacterium]|nr:M36 family metallopeptidase [Xanthomonadales bacterium]
MFERLVRPAAAVAIITLAVCGVATIDVASAQEGPSDGSAQRALAIDIARRHVETHLDMLGLVPGDIAGLTVSDVYTSRHNGVTHVYFQQRYKNIDVFNGLINVNVMPDGKVLHSGNRAMGQLDQRDLAVEPRIPALDAVDRAALAAGLNNTEPFIVLQDFSGPERSVVFSEGDIALEPIRARLVYIDSGKLGLRLAWQVDIYERSAEHYWQTFIDAESGDVLERLDLVVHDQWGDDHGGHGKPDSGNAATARAGVGRSAPMSAADGSDYRVYEMPKEHPNDGPRTLVSEPAYEPASPYGWHDTDGAIGAEHTITRGNNAHAYQDSGSNDASIGDEPDGGATLTFDFPLDLNDAPNQYRDAAVTNLFYWNNLHHDLIYVRGFDEAAGNFQTNNYGNGGAGGDAVRAEAQDGSGTDNANFFTPADGSPPRMQMYVFTGTNPDRDGDLDAGIVLHEYGHGISIRQTGGPANSSCLSTTFYPEQAGEGWSDWQTIVYTAVAGDTRTTNRGVGTYASGQPADGPGIRAAPYNTDMTVDPRTYADTSSASVPHGVGSIWTAMLWEVYWNLVDEYGFNPDFYADWDQGGNLLAMQLVNDGLKMQPCGPGFVDARDAILAADQALTGGANQCLIWEGFAKRGLGFSASQGSSGSNADNDEAFDIPASCAFGEATPSEQMACAGDPVDFDVNLGSAWNAAVNLSASGHPGTAAFSANPVSAPGSSLLTIDSTGGEAAGTYNIAVGATDGSDAEQFPLVLELFDQSPSGTTLSSPAGGDVDVPVRPALSWSAAAGATGYLVEIASDAGFVNIVDSATVDGASYEPGTPLDPGTTYYWRVQPLNPCGAASVSQSFSFTTANVIEICSASSLAIPDNTPAGVDDILNVAASDNILDVNVYLQGPHTYVGDLAFSLTHPDASTQVAVVDRPGVPSSTFGCGANDFDLWVDDEGSDGPVENQCGSSPALFGNPTPNEPLSAFDGLAADGDWTLNASDSVGQDSGSLGEWCLQITLEAAGPGPHAVSAAVGTGNGSISPVDQSIVDGGSASFAVEPDAGYEVASVSGDTCTPSEVGGGNWTAAGVTQACSVTANFQPVVVDYTVTASVDSGQGSITPPSQSVSDGGTANFTVTPDTGWSVGSVTGDTCTPVDAGGGSWTAGSITEACSVTAVFQINQYSVTPSAGSGGVIAPSSPQVVDHGDSLQFSVTPEPGYAIESVGGSCGGTLSDEVYTTDMIEGDCTVDAIFDVIIDGVFEDAFEAQEP